MSWDFTNSTEGWTSSDATLGIGSIGGRSGLRALLDITRSSVVVRVAFCQPQDLFNRSFRATIRYDGPASDLNATAWLNEGSAGGGALALAPLVTGEWYVNYSYQFTDAFLTHPELLDAATHVGIMLITNNASGSLYIDNFHIE